MSGVSFSFQLDASRAKAAFGALRQISDDLTPVLEDIGMELETSTVDRFDTNVAPDGTPWKPSLRATTRGGRTLVQDGVLRDGVHYELDGPTAVVVGAGGAAGAYAGIHQVGGRISAKGGALRFQLATGAFATVKAVNIPARPYLGVSAQDETAIVDIAVDHWRDALVKGIG